MSLVSEHSNNLGTLGSMSTLTINAAVNHPIRSTTNKVKLYNRSSNIDENLTIILEHIRDFKNTLGLVKHIEEPDNAEYKDIMTKLQKNSYEEFMQSLDKSIGKQIKFNPVDGRNNIPSEHTIYMKVELTDNMGKPIITQIKNFSNLNREIIELPVKIKDLTVHSMIGISIYDMNKTENNGLAGSTTLYLFDTKRRLRQGVLDLYLWKNKERDMNLTCRTPGLPPDNYYAESINSLLARIEDKPTSDIVTHKAIKRQLYQYYIDSNSAFLEV